MPRHSVIIFIALFIWLMPLAGARTYIVDDDGFANYKTIGEAIVAASDGDTVYVKPGTYNEEVLLNKSLSLLPLSGEKDPVIVRGDGKKTGITISANGCTLEGLTIENFKGPGISIQSSGNTVSKNKFEQDNPAIFISKSQKNSVTNNIIQDCRGGVALRDNSTDNNIQENEINGGDVSIFLWNVGENSVVGNHATGSTWGIWLTDSKGAKIDANEVKSKTYGIWLQNSSDIKLAENNVSSENAESARLIGILLANSSGIDLAKNRIRGGALGIGISDCGANKLMNNAMNGSDQGIYILNSSGQVLNNNQIKNAKYGMTLENSSENLIRQCQMDNCTVGLGLGTSDGNMVIENSISNVEDTAIQMASSNKNNLSGNQISKGEQGIIMSESSANILENNRFREIKWSLYVEGSSRSGFDNSIDESNLVDEKHIAYLYGQSGRQIQDMELAHLTLAYCENITVEKTAITNDALFLFYSRGIQILDNNVSGCYGMRLVNSTGNEISGNRLLGNKFSGMFLVSSDSNQIENNTASGNNQNGISLLGCNKNTLRDNVVDHNHETGVWLNVSNDNQIYRNNITDNSVGMQVAYSSENRIYHNNFIGNELHSQDIGGNNSWDMGDTIGGNYWSGHVAKGNPSKDWPLVIKGGKLDRYPFQDASGWQAVKPAASSH